MAAALLAAVPARALVNCTGPNTYTVGSTYPKISDALAAVSPTTLTGPVCINIDNSGTFDEQVTVRNFINNGSSITIQALAGQFPSVVPALGGFAIFNIDNASVNVIGIRVSPTVAVNYGIYVSSPNVTITSVSVLDTMSMIDMAGIAPSSWTTVSYTSVSVTQSNAAAFWLQGSTMTTVSYSTAINNSGTRSAVYLDNASNNNFTVLFASNPDNVGIALYARNSDTNTVTLSHLWAASRSVNLNTGSDYNTISFSTIVGRDSFGLWIDNASASNTVTQSYMWGAANGVRLSNDANYNSISFSTIMAGANYALYVGGADSNIVTQSYLRGGSYGAYIDTGSDYNTISLSTLTGNSIYGLYAVASDSNTVTQSYLWGGQYGIYLDPGADSNTISFSTVIGNTNPGLYITAADSNVVTQSYIQGATYGAYLNTSADKTAISLSTIIGIANYGLYAIAATSNTVAQSFVRGGQYGVYLDNNSSLNVISFSTMIGNTNYGYYVTAVASNTVTQSYMQGAAIGAFLNSGAMFNTISLSTMVGNTQYGMQFNDADSNTVTQSYLSGGGIGSYLSSGSEYNAISLSTMIGNSAYGLSLFASGWNTMTQNIMWGGSVGAVMGSGADFNVISLSSMTGSSQYGLNLSGASSNTVTQSWMSGNIHGAYLENNAGRNTISLSTVISNSEFNPALYLLQGTSNAIQSSYIQGSTAVIVNNQNGITIGSSVLVATNTIGTALFVQNQGADGLVIVASTTLRGGPSGRGLLLDFSNQGKVSIGSVTVTGSARGLELPNQTPSFVLAIDSVTFRGLTPGATAIHFLNGIFTSSITLANFEDTSIGANVSGAGLNILSRIGMAANYGVRTGATYENDPNSLVDWQAGPYPGCVVTNNVGAGQIYSTIQSAINALPTTLTGHSCVVIRDGATYNEQVTVRNFINNGSSITILGDPAVSTRPAIVPAAGGFAIFNIANDSVTVAGIRISPTVAVNYGIYISSPNVTISSVSVLDTMSMIDMAGIAASSWTTVSYSSVSVNNGSASAIWLQGSTMTTVSYSSAANNSGSRPTLFLGGASSNTITGVVATNLGAAACSALRIESGTYNSVSRSSFTTQLGGGCSAFRLYSSSFNTLTQSYLSGRFSGAELNGSAFNTISLSTVISGSAASRALYLTGADSNTVTGSYLESLSGYGAFLDAGADYNTISQSTMVSNSGGMFALYLAGSDGNTVTGSYISNEAGDGAMLNSGADYNTISQSTITVTFALARALYVIGADSNTVTGSYISSLTGDGAYLTTGAECNTISQSTMVSNSASRSALHLLSTSSNTITGSYITNPAGYSAYLNAGANSNTISLSTMVSVASGGAGLYIDGSDSNTVTGSYMSNPAGFSATVEAGADYNTISLSTMASSASNYALYFGNSVGNTVAQSLVLNPAGSGVILDAGANYNTISQSTIASGGANLWALKIVGSSTNTIQFSYIQGSTAVIVSGSTGTVINSSVLVATNTIGTALALQQGGYGLTLASSTLRGGPSGRGLLLDVGFSSTVSIGSVTVTGSARGLEISTQPAGFVLAIDSVTFRGLTAGATAIHYLGGTFTSSITLASFEDASVGANVSGAALDPASRISMFAHYGVRTSTAYENDPGSLVHWEAGPYPGCTVTKNVGLGQPFTTISAGVAALPTTLTGHSCVVIRDTATYSGDLVLVQGFTNNGSSITIRGDAALAGRPTVRMGFVIFNASVNIANVDVVPTVALNTGIFVSSPNVTISSVNVIDPSGQYSVAGIVVSSWTTVSYTSVTVNHFSAAAMWLAGSTMTTVAYSTVVNNSDSRPALFLDGASSNTIMGVVAVNQAAAGCNAVRVDNGNYNSVSLSSFTASTGGCSAFRLNVSSFNTVTQSFLRGSSRGADLNNSAFNTISFSTVVGNSSQGLYGLGADSNTATQSYFQSGNIGAYWDAGSNDNTISLSTMVGSGTAGLYIDTTASSNSVTRSYMWGSTHGLVIGNSNFNAISLSTMIGNTQNGLYATVAASNTVTQSYMQGSQRGAWLDTNSNGNIISLSTMIGTGTVGLYISAADSNTVTQSYLWGSGYGAYLATNADGNIISLSTMFGNSNSGLYIFGGDVNIAERSYMWGGNSGAYMDQFSDYNTISLSTVISNSALNPALYFLQGTSNTVHGSYIQGSTAVLVSNSIGVAIESSVLVATSTIGNALAVQNQGIGGLVTVASTTLRGGPSGRGLLLDFNNQGLVSIGSVTVTGSRRGLEISTQATGFVLAVDSITFRGLTAGATAIHYLGGTFTSSFTLANFEDTSVGANVSAAALDPASRISMFAHYGVRTSTSFENDPNSVVGWEAGPYPGCVVTRNVGLGQPYVTISSGVAALPTTLTGHSCVVIRDGATYNEQVTVSGFTNNLSSITIMSDPASSTVTPRVVPPASSVAAFRIMNSSVNLIGIDVRPSGGVTYGISVTSPNVTISSVIVYDPFNAISLAGISLSSWVTVSYTSVTMNNTIAFWLRGTNTTVSYSSATNNVAGGNAVVQLTGASSNTLTNLWARNTSGTAVRFDGGGGNTVSQSSFSSQNNEGLYLSGSATNTISGTWMGSTNGYGLRLDSSNRNIISQSTAVSNMAAFYGLYLNSSSSNSISGVFASNPQGYGAYLTGSSSNTISLSTMTSDSAGARGLYITSGSSNVISGSYMGNSSANGVGAYFFNTSSNTLSQSTVAGGANTYGLILLGSSGNQIANSKFISGAQLTSTSNDNVITGSTFTHNSGTNDAFRLAEGSSNTISQCFMSNTLGYGLSIGGGGITNYNAVSQSTITGNVAALYLRGTGNSLVSDYIAGGTGYGAEVLTLYYSSILQSTITNNSAVFPAMYLWSSATNTITQSVVANSNNAGTGILLDNGANWNSISQSVVKGGASGIKAQLISGLNISLSSVTGGSGAANAGVWGDLMTDYITIDNSYVQGSTGVYLNGSSRTIVTANVLAGSGVSGSGFYSANNSETLTLSANTVLGGGEAGIGIVLGGGLIRLSTNTVISRTAKYGIGVALLSPTAALWITSNTIIPALSAAATTYGVYLDLLAGGATVQNNGIYYRTAGGAFTGVGAGAYGLYAAQVTGLRVDHNRISNPSMVTSGNYIGAGLDAMSNAIFKFNDLYATGSGVTTFNHLRLTGAPNAVVRNNILSSSMTATANRIILVDGPSRTGLSSDYNTFFSSNSSYNGYWDASQVSLLLNWITTTGGRDANTLSGNPRWVNPVGEDFHPLSRAGRWNGSGFVQDAVDGSGTDRGDTADSVDDEVEPNGARANQGSYGQTAEASQTVLPCPITKYVKSVGGDATTITGGIAALDNPLPAYSCVVIGDNRIYNEQVTVEGFINNGSSITIMLDPALTVHPTVRSGFVIKNASVNIVNIDVIPDNGLAYGIIASSANITISSVNVNESFTGGAILTAGIVLSSYSSLSYSSVAVLNAHGVRLDGKFAVVSYSTMTNNSAFFNALFISGAASNTVTASYLSNPQGYTAQLDFGADYNTISQSTITSGAVNFVGLYINNAKRNTVTGSYIEAASGYGALLGGGASFNTISFSTMVSNDSNRYALYLNNADSNTVTGSLMQNFLGYGALLQSGSDNNTISYSTMSSNAGGRSALYILESDSNTVTGSYIVNPAGYGAHLASGADFNTIDQSVIEGNGTPASGVYALYVTAAATNTVTRSYIKNPLGYAAFITGGASRNTISLSTITSNGANNAALTLMGSALDTIQNSYIQGSTAAVISGSTGTVINSNVLVATNTVGSALALQGGSLGLAMSSNTIIPGPQGAGVYLGAGNAGTITLSTNTIPGGRYGLYIAAQQAGTALWISSNTILPVPVAAFNTYGIYLNGLTSGATIQNNGVYYRSPGFTGANLTAPLGTLGCDGLVVSGNRFSNPGMVTAGSIGNAFVESTNNTVFKFNDFHSTGTALANAYLIYLQNSPGTQVRGNVFSSSWTVTSGSSAIGVDAASQAGFLSNYNNFFSSNSFNSIQWGATSLQFPWYGAIGQDGRSQSLHPRWANPSAGAEDFHHLSQAGRWNGVSFVNDTYTSGLIDAADPSEPFVNELASNGSRPNLGSYSNTAEASKSPAPPTSPAVAGVFTSSISVSYGLVSADGYTVIASTAADLTGTLFSSSTANVALAVLAPQSLAPNTTYFLRVGAVWGDYFTLSGVVLATATLANPAAAASPAFGEVNISSLTVSWLPNGNTVDVTTYSVVLTTGASYPNAFAGNQTFSTVPVGVLPTATRTTGLAPNTTYFAFVAGINWSGVPSVYAAVGSTPTLAADPATAITTFTGIGFSSFTVSWSANGNPLSITTYTVNVSTAADFNDFASSFTFSTAPAFGPTATFTGLGANEIYFFRVRAYNHQGIASAYAVLGSTLTRPVTLQAPVIAGVTAVNISSITATWGLTTLATGYTLVASLTNDPLAVFASSAPVGINATTATVFTPALNSNTTYFLFVQANGPGASTVFSAYPATSTLADLPATAVTTFTGVNLTSMTVSWSPGGNPIDVTTYTVVLSTGISYPNLFFGNRTISTMPAGAGPAASISGLSDNTLYYLHIAAINHNGRVSAYSALGSTVTRISAPSTIVFDEISSNTIVASAYVATPFFSNLGVGQSGTQISKNTIYQPVHGEQWVSTTALPAPLSEAGAAGFNSLVYVFGGINGGAVQKSARVYDPVTNLWSSLPDISSTRYGLAGAFAGGKIYAVGGTPDGGASLSVNEEYDPVTNTWATKAVLPTGADHLSAVGVGSGVYAFGGVNSGTEIDQTAQFDPVANAWTVRPIFPVTQTQMAAAAAAGPGAGMVIAAGGGGPTNSNYGYNTVANTWAAKTFMPAAVEQGAAASLGGKIYVFGGALASQGVYEYDVAADTWVARTNMITGRAGLTAVAAGGHIYAMGGSADGGATSLNTNEAYDPGVATRFTGLTPNVLVNFRARARNQTGTLSAQTAVISTYTWAALPGTVAAPFAVVEVDSVTFSWALNNNPPSTEFKTRASTSSSYGGGAAVLVSDWGAMTSTATLALTPNSTYFFSVQARNVPGITTAFVALGSTSTLAAVPASAPVQFGAVATNGLTVSWLPNGNPVSITTYTVVVSTEAVYPNANTGNRTVVSTQPAGALPTATLTGLVANTTYFAFASAVNWNGVRTVYAALGSTSTLALAPIAAVPTFAAVHESSATYSWGANTNPVDVTTYSVVLSTGSSFNSFFGNVILSTTPSGSLPTATAVAGLIPNTTYFGYAAAINWNGAVSAYTALGSTATLAVLPATAVSTFSGVFISSLTVSWSAAGNPLTITSYTVTLSTASDFNAFATSVTFTTAPAAGPSATFTGLTDFTEYFFQVRAVNHGGSATAFVSLGSTTTVIAPLGVPALAGFTSVSSTTISATWGLVTGATGYTFVASLSPANPPVAIAASSTTMSIAATTATVEAPSLLSNTSYFLFVQANGPLRSSLFAAYGATSTLAAPPLTAVSTFTGVGITSFTVSWDTNGNALAITTYTVQLSTAADFNTFATSITFTTVPVFGSSMMLTGLSGNTSYYLRIRALNHNSVPSAFVNLGSTLTVVSPLFPSVLDSQTGDDSWRRSVGTLYQVAFLDTSGSHLDKFQVSASTTAGGLGTNVAPLTDVIIGLSPADSYNTPWALPGSVFNSLIEGVTNYITVKVFNGPPLNNFTVLQDAFYVQKDTTAPIIVNTQAGDAVARSVPGTTYTVGVRDPSSGLAAFQYSASLVAGSANAAVIPWTDIPVVANTTSYTTPWPVDFAALISGVTNYISVRSWDTAGTTTTLNDAFFVHKDTTGPSVAIAAPQNSSFNSALATLSGTAASIYGVQGTEVSVLDILSGLYWNPASVAFNSAAPIMMPASGTTAWTLSPGIPWVNGANYRAVARSSTTANIYSATYATATFVMDLSAPTVVVQAPVPNSTVSVLPVLSGTSADPAPNPAGLSSVEVRLRRNTDGLWWNWFTQVWGPTAVSSITAGTAAWSLSPTSQLKGNLDSGTSYFIAVRGSDNALPSNQGDFFVSGATFTWQDVTPPAAVTDLATAHGALPGSINLSWTAPGDDAGVGAISLGEYRIFYSTDIAAVASTSTAQVVISTAGVNPGAAQFRTLSSLSPGVTYYISLALADSDGNWSAFSNQASTTAAPSPLNAITGHVLDISTQGITAVQVDCWNSADALMGTTFTLADGSGTFSVTSLPAGSYKLRVTWTVNGFSSSLWQDGITMGSTNVDFFLNIDYALATLTGTLSSLTASSFGGPSAAGLGVASAESFIELHQQGRQVARTMVQPGGRWSIPGLLPGTYSVRAHTGLGYTAFQDVQLSEGEVRVLAFVFDPLPTASVFAFPNPARTSTTIRFETALAPLEAGIYIFDLVGNLVKEFSDSQISRMGGGLQHVVWNLNNSSGQSVAPGVYNVMVKIRGGTENQSATVIKKLAVVR